MGPDRLAEVAGTVATFTIDHLASSLEHLGAPAFKDRWLPAVADGEAIVSFGIIELGAGSAVHEMRASLRPDGTGRWRLTGYKNYSTLGHVASAIVAWCRWPGGDGAKGVGAVIVPMDRDGVSDTGRQRGMGIDPATEVEIAFDSVEIVEDEILLVGDLGAAESFKVLLSHLNHKRCGNAAMHIGAAQGASKHAASCKHDWVVGVGPWESSRV